MKIVKIKLFTFCLLLIGLTSVAQARINYWSIAADSDSFAFNAFLPVTGNKYCSNADSPLTDAEIDDIIRVHNDTRQAVGTAPLKWNCALADFAQKWANKDTFEHSPEKDRTDIIKGSVSGENLSNDSETTQIMQKLIQGWIDEKAFLASDAKTCAAGKICGHYTQMVWKTTTEVGCGVYRKSNSLGAEYKDKASYFVCIYNPMGNTDGERAY